MIDKIFNDHMQQVDLRLTCRSDGAMKMEYCYYFSTGTSLRWGSKKQKRLLLVLLLRYRSDGAKKN
jgi:hypothetical protein